jgi:hypothetical protein
VSGRLRIRLASRTDEDTARPKENIQMTSPGPQVVSFSQPGSGKRDVQQKPLAGRKYSQLTGEEVLDRIDGHNKTEAVADLVRVARGTAMILDALWDKFERSKQVGNIASGLADALMIACDRADFNYFQSSGEIAHTLSPNELKAVLAKEIRNIKVKS